MPGSTKSKRNSLKERVRKIRGLKISLRRREILRHLKYSPGRGEVDPHTETIIQQQLQQAYQIIYPSVIYLTVSRKMTEFKEIEKSILQGPEKVKKIASDAIAVTVMASTAGEEIEKEIDKIKEKDLTRAIILDAAGSEAAEQALNFVSSLLRGQAKKDECRLGDRISPGYGGWSHDVTGEILDVLDASKIGIEYLPSGIMKPRKSVAAVHPWFK